MPIEINRLDKQCPQCKNDKMFNVDDKFYFCKNCGGEFNYDLTQRNPTTVQQTPYVENIQDETPIEEPQTSIIVMPEQSIVKI